MKVTKVIQRLIQGLALGAMIIASTACTRIETGEVGVRINASKQIEGTELQAGSFNQTIIGSILTFPVKDITVAIDNKTPMTADNSPLADFDITVVYGLNPTSVAELYSTKSKSFHSESGGDIYLMHSYMTTLVNNAAYKVVREYKSLEVADNRAKIEAQIRDVVSNELKDQKLDTSVTLTVVQIRNILPNADILKSATDYVRSQNALKIAENEVKLAKLESERMAALASNSGQSIAYMQAQATLNLSQAALNGKINTILIPHGMTMFGAAK
jgi:SPFH domain / Band 7 family